MRTVIAALFTAATLASFTSTAEAVKKRSRDGCDIYCQRYPSATPRQLKNARAYDRGGYYEQDPDAHPVGSPGWWYLKERERDGGLRF